MTTLKIKKIPDRTPVKISLNLPPVTNAVGTRATRTTHPQTLTRFTNLFSRIFDTPYRIENPFFWRTKKEVVETISKLGFASQIAHTRSCADVHNLTRQYSHCGRCSQCIDRRFALLAAGLERFDPEEAYRVDLMEGERIRVIDREIALSYVRSSIIFETMGPVDLEQHFPQISRVVAHLGEPEDAALRRLSHLLRRHAAGVVDVMQKTLKERSIDEFGTNTQPGLFGNFQREQLTNSEGISSPFPEKSKDITALELRFGPGGKKLTIDRKSVV